MARKKGGKPLEDHIAELEAVVGEIDACPECGGTIDPDASTCPHCGTPVHEAAELRAKAAESLEELGKHLDESVDGESPAESMVPPPPPDDPDEEEVLASAAAIATEVRQPEVVAQPAPRGMGEAAPIPSVEWEAAPESESPDLEGFIASIEEEVGVEAPTPARAAAASKPAVRTARRTAPPPRARSRRWVAAVAGGLVLYILSLVLVSVLEKVFAASFMVVGTFLVVAGIGAKPGLPVGPGAGRAKPASEYLCPLCGTEISTSATMCPTCGAVFEA